MAPATGPDDSAGDAPYSELLEEAEHLLSEASMAEEPSVGRIFLIRPGSVLSVGRVFQLVPEGGRVGKLVLPEKLRVSDH